MEKVEKCGCSYDGKNRRFCSVEHYTPYIEEKLKKKPEYFDRRTNCLYCKNPFLLSNKTSTTKFCSSICYGSYVKENPGAFQAVQEKTRVSLVCDNCGCDYEVHNYRSNNSKWCSKKCKADHHVKDRKLLKCHCCNREVSRAKWELFIDGTEKKRVFCSVNCSRNVTNDELMSTRTSIVEQNLQTELSKLGFEFEMKTGVKRDNGKYFYPDMKIGNKLIEVYGTYWHSDPKVYPASYFNKNTNLTAKEKWEIDENRLGELESYGYETLVIWESEITSDTISDVIKKCVKFLRK